MLMVFIINMVLPRQTKQKLLIQQQIETLDSFFNAEELYQKINSIDPGVGIATIYRYLKTAVLLGELHSYICDRKQVFSKTKQHCHFIDEESGKITHFEIQNLDFLKNKIPGNISSIQIEIRGKQTK